MDIKTCDFLPQEAKKNLQSILDEIVSDIDIGVSILNYGGSDDTIRCVTSVLTRTALPTFSVIVENGSAPDEKRALRETLSDTGEQLQEFSFHSRGIEFNLVPYTVEDSAVLFIDLDTNIGFTPGNNLAVEVFDTLELPNTLILNNDAVIRTNSIKRLAKTLAENADTAAVSPVIHSDGDIWYAGGEYTKWGYEYSSHQKFESTDYRTELYSGCCVLFDTNTYLALGGMFEPLFISIDEPEFSRRIIEAGYEIRVEPRAEAMHRLSQTLGPAGSKYHDYFYVRNLFLYSSLHSSDFESIYLYAIQLFKLLRPLLETTGGERTSRAGTGLQAIIDFSLSRLGPGRWWSELNSLPPEDGLWDIPE